MHLLTAFPCAARLAAEKTLLRDADSGSRA